MNKLVNEIKSHEKRYTIILVILFIVLIIGAFYYTLSIDNKSLKNKKINYRYSNISSSYQTITLNSNNNSLVNSNNYTITIDNNTSDKIEYKVLLLEDINSKKVCDCNNTIFDLNRIRYSLDKKDINKLNNDNIITEGVIDKKTRISININLWLNENDNNHFHGYFKIIKIQN
ncbi:MAG: hypothetical protein IJ097_02815 [Bacilli bacterium]|nr:hypothetical protein [Bacilli bacterium]